MEDNFNLHEWNKKRYLNELDINKDDEIQSLDISHGGDDPKIGAELESDANVVGEGLNDRISKIYILYTEQGRLYKVEVSGVNNKANRLSHDDANDLLKMLNIKDEIPFRMSFGDEKILDKIIKQLQDQGIEASWSDHMDVS
jgi:hypothetical protein